MRLPRFLILPLEALAGRLTGQAMRIGQVRQAQLRLVPVPFPVFLVPLPHVAHARRDLRRMSSGRVYPPCYSQLLPTPSLLIEMPHESISSNGGWRIELVKCVPIGYGNLGPKTWSILVRDEPPHLTVASILPRWVICTVGIPVPDLFLGPLLLPTLVHILPHKTLPGWLRWRMRRAVYIPVRDDVLTPHPPTIQCDSIPHEPCASWQVRGITSGPARDEMLLPGSVLKDPHQTVSRRLVGRSIWSVTHRITMDLCPCRYLVLFRTLPHESFAC
mmetsp:Transcript_67719/g.158865  ORF Transcript_67719/g.158865 Transcript_67719/m.158865 type:complete len:274 (+) Transcript_67719:198-1019(+)